MPNNPNKLPSCGNNEFLDTPFDLTEFNLALNSKSCKSAPGPDGIDYFILQNLPLNYKLILIDIYNEMYSTGSFPSSWKNSYVHFIKKANGKSYRPISLTSCVCKVFETLVKQRLQYWCEKNDLLPKSQTGFRKGQSCYDNLTNLSLYINEGFILKKSTIAAFLDVKGAFDNVVCDILLNKLASIGCSYNLVIFIKFLIYERKIHSEFIDCCHRLIHKGVPQGGVLSPLLYTLYVAHITNNISKNVKIPQFADDIALYTKFGTLKNSKNLIQKSISIVKNNLFNLGLDLCDEKTVIIHFNRNNITPGNLEIEIDGIKIKSTDSTRILGIIFDF